jgi:hypothetical protein
MQCKLRKPRIQGEGVAVDVEEGDIEVAEAADMAATAEIQQILPTPMPMKAQPPRITQFSAD